MAFLRVKESNFGSEDKIRYDGEWKKGLIHGDGSFYWENKKLNYKGHWEHDKRHGFGTDYEKDGVTIRYEGDWEHDENYGFGTQYMN